MKKVLVTGANGQLGKSLAKILQDQPLPDFEFIFAGRDQLDISNQTTIEAFFFSNTIDVCINCAAYTAVDLAESEAEAAFQVNADGVKFLAKECQAQNAVLIHVSTDYVFDGESDQPYTETDHTNPINVYGKSKLEGERLALDYCQKTYVVRSSWIYSEFGKNFYTTMTKLLNERDEISVVADQFGRPTSAKALARALLKLMQSDAPYGLYHYAEQAPTTWHAFAQQIAVEIGSSAKVNPIQTKQYPTPAKRPKYSVMNTEKIEAYL